MRTLHRPTRLLALLLALLLPLAAACGGDDSSDDDSSGSGSDTEQETSTEDDGGEDDASSETTAAEDDALAAAIEAQSEALGIEDAIEDGDDLTLVMEDGTDAAGAQAACAFAAQLNPDATISVDVDGTVTPCP